MGQFLHPNVVKLYGVVTVGEPVSVCVHVCVTKCGPRGGGVQQLLIIFPLRYAVFTFCMACPTVWLPKEILRVNIALDHQNLSGNQVHVVVA